MIRMLPILLFLTFHSASAQSGAAQDTIFLMNGHVIAERIIDTTLGAVTIFNPDRHGKKLHYEWDQLYMVRFRSGEKRYYYVQDSVIGNWFTRDEMWMYMKGENDARAGFRPRGSVIGSFLSGMAGGMTGTLWGPVAPYGFMAFSGLPLVRIRHSTVSNPTYLGSDAYVLGYERVARQKRKIVSLIGGTVGLAAGYAFYALFHHNYPETLDLGFRR